jgi:hypothetical protein
MAKKLKVLLKATDQKALDDYQDFEKMSIAEQSIIKNARLGRYKFFSYDPNLGKNKHVLEILKGKSKVSPRNVQELLSPLIKDKDPYVSKAIIYLINLKPRCFWVEVSKAPQVKSYNDFGCTREYELGISEFAAHHATKSKNETDKPYDENLGLYYSISGSSSDFIYYYKSEEELRNKILEVLRKKSKNLNNPFFDILNNLKLEEEKENEEN